MPEKGSVLMPGNPPGANPGVSAARWCQRGAQQICKGHVLWASEGVRMGVSWVMDPTEGARVHGSGVVKRGGGTLFSLLRDSGFPVETASTLFLTAREKDSWRLPAKEEAWPSPVHIHWYYWVPSACSTQAQCLTLRR